MQQTCCNLYNLCMPKWLENAPLKIMVFFGYSNFLPQGILTVWVGDSLSPGCVDLSHKMAAEVFLESWRLDQVELVPLQFSCK